MPGAAVDGEGNEIYQGASRTLTIDPEAFTLPRTVYVTIRYRESETDYVENVDAQEYSGFTRITELPEITLATSQPDNNTVLELARIELTEGAERLVEALHRHCWKVGVVSGGFTFFTERIKQRLGLDYARANVLEIKNGRLTGSVLGDIVDAETKRRCLLEQAEIYSIPLSQTIAMGDGANDLPMIKAAGMGVAFHAKPKVVAEAPFAIQEGGLDRVLELLA